MTFKTMCVAGLITLAAAMPASADTLSSAQIKGLAPGRYAVSILGFIKMTITMQPGGSIQGTTSKKKSDTGRWTVQGEKFCITWNRWLKGRQRCTSLSGGDGKYSGSGVSIRKI
jgi:acyl dehydratase